MDKAVCFRLKNLANFCNFILLYLQRSVLFHFEQYNKEQREEIMLKKTKTGKPKNLLRNRRIVSSSGAQDTHVTAIKPLF